MPKTSFSNNDFYPWITTHLWSNVQNIRLINIASESIYNPRAFRALSEQALDPSRKGPRTSRTYIHTQYQDF